MDKKYEIKDYDDMTYEEVHALLVEVMQEACASDEAGPYKSPSIDLSFMEEKPEKAVRRKFTVNRFAKVAAILIIVLLGMNVIMLSTGANVSYSERGLLHRIYEGARGIFTDEDETDIVELNEMGKTYTITDMNKIDDAKKFWPDLCVPEYIPEGFELELLAINKEISGKCYAEYKYKNKNNELTIIITEKNTQIEYSSVAKAETIQMDDRIICLYNDSQSQAYVADIFFEDKLVYVYGNVTKEELLIISQNII